MKITFALPHVGLHGGVRVIAIYAERLVQRGHEVTLVSLPLKTKGRGIRGRLKLYWRNFRRYGWRNITSVPSHLDGLRGVKHHVLDDWRPLSDADVPDADVIIATWWETAEWVMQMSRVKGAKVLLIQHYEVHIGQPADRVDATWRLPVHKIAISEWLANLARDKFGDKNVSLVPNSVDTELFQAPEREKQATPTIGLMYSHTHFKGCDISLKAIELARREVPDLKLLTFGTDAPNVDLPLPPNAVHAQSPPQTTIRDIYAGCDAWIVGSRFEGFGLPILESMACRTPVIGTPTGAAPPLLRSGGGILLEQLESVEEMAEAIVKIAKMSPQDWKQMSDIAYETAHGYSWDDAIDLLEEALEAAVRRADAGEI